MAWRQVMISTNAGWLSIEPLGNEFQWGSNNQSTKVFIKKLWMEINRWSNNVLHFYGTHYKHPIHRYYHHNHLFYCREDLEKYTFRCYRQTRWIGILKQWIVKMISFGVDLQGTRFMVWSRNQENINETLTRWFNCSLYRYLIHKRRKIVNTKGLHTTLS